MLEPWRLVGKLMRRGGETSAAVKDKQGDERAVGLTASCGGACSCPCACACVRVWVVCGVCELWALTIS